MAQGPVACESRRNEFGEWGVGGVTEKPVKKAQLAPQVSKADLALGNWSGGNYGWKETLRSARGGLGLCSSQSLPRADNGPALPELPIFIQKPETQILMQILPKLKTNELNYEWAKGYVCVSGKGWARR